MPEYTGPKRAGDVAAREAEAWLEHQPKANRGRVARALETADIDRRDQDNLAHEAELDRSEAEWRATQPKMLELHNADGSAYQVVDGGPDDPFGPNPVAKPSVDSTQSRVLVNGPGPVHKAASEWGDRQGTKLGAALKERISPESLDAARTIARKYLDMVHAKREQADTRPVPIVQRYNDALDPTFRNDREKEILHEKADDMARYDGEIPAGKESVPRPPTGFTREHSNDTEKEAYLERIRQAQRNASK